MEAVVTVRGARITNSTSGLPRLNGDLSLGGKQLVPRIQHLGQFQAPVDPSRRTNINCRYFSALSRRRHSPSLKRGLDVL